MKPRSMIRHRAGVLLALLVPLVLAACNGDSTGSSRPSAVVVSDGDAQTSLVGTALPKQLKVRVTGSGDRPFSGAVVRWKVASGAATVQPDSSVTDASGVATASVTLGSRSGPFSVTATVDGVAPVTFNGTAASGSVSKAEVMTTGLTGVVGTALATRVNVRVTDQYGNPVPGVTVKYSTTGGGKLDPAEVATSAEGFAQATWTLGPRAGTQFTVAEVAGLAPVSLSAVAAPGAPSKILKSPGSDQQRAVAGSRLSTAFGFTATDAFDNPVAGQTVTWTVVAGGGTLTSATTTTSSSGSTSNQYTLGAGTGTNTVTATLGGVTTTFTATSVDACSFVSDASEYSFFSGSLATTDCRAASGAYVDRYRVRLSFARTVRMDLRSSAFDAYLLVSDSTGERPIAEDNNGLFGSDSRVNVALPAGAYQVSASSMSPGATGTYSLDMYTGYSVDCGYRTYTVRGVSFPSEYIYTTSSCRRADGRYSEQVWVYLRAGESITVGMTSASFDPYLFLFNPSGTTAAANDNAAAGSTAARITFTATETGFHRIEPSTASTTAPSFTNLLYSLTIQ